jgi:hypothetical protein
MIKKEVYKAIRDKVLGMAEEIKAAGFKPISRVEVYNRQYNELEMKDKHVMPPRPVLYIEFGSTPWKKDAGRKRSMLPVTLHLVQDCFSDGRSGSGSEEKYLKLLEFPEWLASKLDEFPIPEQAPLYHTESTPDHDHDQLLVERLWFQVNVKG